MNLPYRTRRRLRSLGIFALVLILAAVLIWLVWLLWLDRYVVYSREGAALDFSRSAEELSGQVALPPEEKESITIVYNDGSDAVDTSTDLAQISGYFIDTNALIDDIAGVRKQVEALPIGTAVMVSLKDIYGNFYYSTELGPETSAVDITAVDELISYLRGKNLYMIACVPAFRDYYYGLHHDTYGLPHSSGGYLWADEKNCYWLNPDSEGTMNYLVQIVTELRDLGFNEVVFNEFCFPDTDNILYNGDRTESLNKAASTLVASCTTTTFAVSFCVEQGSITLPNGRCRLYFEDISAFNAQGVAEDSGLEEPEIKIVFLTQTNDTRFDEYSVLRPISLVSAD